MSPNKNNSKMAKPCNHMCSSAKYMYNPFPLWVGVILGVLFTFSASPHCRRLPPTPTVAPLFSRAPKSALHRPSRQKPNPRPPRPCRRRRRWRVRWRRSPRSRTALRRTRGSSTFSAAAPTTPPPQRTSPPSSPLPSSRSYSTMPPTLKRPSRHPHSSALASRSTTPSSSLPSQVLALPCTRISSVKCSVLVDRQ